MYAWISYYAAWLDAQGVLNKIPTLQLDALASGPERTSKHSVYLVIGRALLFTRLGRFDAARAMLAQIPPSELARLPLQYGDLGAMCSLAETYCLQGDVAAARELYPRLVAYAGLNAVGPSFEYFGAVAHFLGRLALLLGDDAAAREHFRRAVELNRLLAMPLRLADSQRELAALGG